MPKKIRLSYSFLSLWERGDIDGAISTYYHLDRPTSKAMEDGKRIHEEIADHITEVGQLPDWLIPFELKLPEPEKEVVVSYNDLFDLKCYMDCYDPVRKVLLEFKTGKTDSLAWTRTWQLPIYFLIAEIEKIPIDYALLIHHNQHTKENDFTVVHNAPIHREYARNIIDSIGNEIWSYFDQNGLL